MVPKGSVEIEVRWLCVSHCDEARRLAWRCCDDVLSNLGPGGALCVVSYQLEADGLASLRRCEGDFVLCQGWPIIDICRVDLYGDWVIWPQTLVSHQLVARDATAAIIGGCPPRQTYAGAIAGDSFRSRRWS